MPKTSSRDTVERYLRRLWGDMGLGTKETSGYPALADLLNTAGETLTPKVRAINHPGKQKSGIPDFGLFTQQQLRGVEEGALTTLLGLPAERGLLEVKGFDDDVEAIAKTEQVAKYLKDAGLVLVTNYWDFLVVTRGPDGETILGDRFRLTNKAKEFRGLLAAPASIEEDRVEGLIDFLRRTLLRKATLADPRDVADLLASYARDARRRIERRGGMTGLTALRRSMEGALGISFEGEQGAAFFRSTLVQTLFYGAFSAWVLWNDQGRPGDRFDWRTTGFILRVPVVQALFSQIAQPQRLKDLELMEVLDWTGDTLNRVQHEAFFDQFEREHAVRYFYEPFLEFFAPKLRRDLGVWYTPPQVVSYMVARVDRALQDELGIADGLADERVHILDPATGTGSFPVEILKVIATRLRRNGAGAALGLQIKRAATERIHAFELLPAPYVIAHMQVALLLEEFGTSWGERPDGTVERASIFLTNSLTGWRQGDRFTQESFLPELSREREEAHRIKQDEKIWVVIGNPPYSAFAGVQPLEEGESVEIYKQGLSTARDKGGWGISKFNLDDFYVRFLRLAEHRIVEQTGYGIVCYISNYSYLSDPSFVVLRERFQREFDSIWIDSLTGDSRETGKRTPDGDTDPSIFSTEYNKAGIRLGTAVGLFVRREKGPHGATVQYRDFWGAGKADALLASLDESATAPTYTEVVPSRDRRFDFRPAQIASHYFEWPIPSEWAAEKPISGLQEMRRGDLMDHDPVRLRERMSRYFSPSETLTSLKEAFPGMTSPAGNFEPRAARAKLLDSNAFANGAVVRYSLFPLDNRWAFLSTTPPLWNRPRPDLLRHSIPGNQFLHLRFRQASKREGIPMMFSSALPDYHLLTPNAVAIPLRLVQPRQAGILIDESTDPNQPQDATQANLSPRARSYLHHLDFFPIPMHRQRCRRYPGCTRWPSGSARPITARTRTALRRITRASPFPTIPHSCASPPTSAGIWPRCWTRSMLC